MVVDDDTGVLDTYSDWLSDRYDVVTASGGLEALERMDEDVSVVLLDRRMPGISGDDVLEEIRKRNCGCRVAIVTAAEPDFGVIDMGFDAYLVKPVTEDELVNTAGSLLRRVEYGEKVRRYHSLVTKKVLLSTKTDDELARSDGYRTLLDELEQVESEVDEMSREMSEEGFRAVVRDIQDSE